MVSRSLALLTQADYDGHLGVLESTIVALLGADASKDLAALVAARQAYIVSTYGGVKVYSLRDPRGR